MEITDDYLLELEGEQLSCASEPTASLQSNGCFEKSQEKLIAKEKEMAINSIGNDNLPAGNLHESKLRQPSFKFSTFSSTQNNQCSQQHNVSTINNSNFINSTTTADSISLFSNSEINTNPIQMNSTEFSQRNSNVYPTLHSSESFHNHQKRYNSNESEDNLFVQRSKIPRLNNQFQEKKTPSKSTASSTSHHKMYQTSPLSHKHKTMLHSQQSKQATNRFLSLNIPSEMLSSDYKPPKLNSFIPVQLPSSSQPTPTKHHSFPQPTFSTPTSKLNPSLTNTKFHSSSSNSFTPSPLRKSPYTKW